jgi:hypothetical protein
MCMHTQEGGVTFSPRAVALYATLQNQAMRETTIYPVNARVCRNFGALKPVRCYTEGGVNLTC